MRFLTSFGMTIVRLGKQAFSGISPKMLQMSARKLVIPNEVKRNEESPLYKEQNIFTIFYPI